MHFSEHQKHHAKISPLRVVMYVDDAGKIRWRLLAKQSSAIVADSAQGYRHKRDAIRGLVLTTSGEYEHTFRSHNHNGVYEQAWIHRFRDDGQVEAIFVEYKR